MWWWIWWGIKSVWWWIFDRQSFVVVDSSRSIVNNEVLAAESLEGSYFIYQVTDALANPKISAIVRNPMKYVEQKKMLLEPWIYKMFI